MSATAAAIELTRRLGSRRLNVLLFATYTTALFFSAVLVIIANIITDMTYRLVDPRVGASKS